MGYISISISGALATPTRSLARSTAELDLLQFYNFIYTQNVVAPSSCTGSASGRPSGRYHRFHMRSTQGGRAAIDVDLSRLGEERRGRCEARTNLIN